MRVLGCRGCPIRKDPFVSVEDDQGKLTLKLLDREYGQERRQSIDLRPETAAAVIISLTDVLTFLATENRQSP